MSITIAELVETCGSRAMEAGWYKDYDDMCELIRASAPDEAAAAKKLTFWEKVWNGNRHALITSEVSESLEGLRKSKQDEHLPQFSSVAVELGDAVIRIADYCYANKINLEAAILAKLEYNAVRPDHKLENRVKDGGKAF